MNKNNINQVVLAYSGGLDTSVIIPWIKENYQAKVIAFVADVGQNRAEIENIEEKALKSGASKCYIVDLREKFISNYVYPVLKTGALYEGSYLLGTAMARPVIAKAQVDLALSLGADCLCHGATGKGNDQVRFETAYAALAPELKVIAPWREWIFCSREDLLLYLKNKNIPTTASLEKIYSRDENAWHISTEGGILENPWNIANEDCWTWTTNPQHAPNVPEYISIAIEEGCVVKINHNRLTPFQCLELLNKISAQHGIGRIDIVENRLIGIKSRGCYETPGGTVMVKALRAIEQLVLDRDSFKWREQLGMEMSSIVYDGKWFAPFRKSLQASANSLASEITGEVVIELYKGNATVVQKKSPNSLYSEEFATFSADQVYDHADAKGFIKLYSLSHRIRAKNKHNQKFDI